MTRCAKITRNVIPYVKNPIIQPMYMMKERPTYDPYYAQRNLIDGGREVLSFFGKVAKKLFGSSEAEHSTSSASQSTYQQTYQPSTAYKQTTYQPTTTVTQAPTTVTREVSAPVTRSEVRTSVKTQTVSSLPYMRELSSKTAEYRQLQQEYMSLYAKKAEAYFTAEKTMTLSQLETMIPKIREKIQHERLMLKLERNFTHGAQYYMPGGRGNSSGAEFKPEHLSDIIPNEQAPYVQELKRLCSLFVKNSKKFDVTLLTFKGISEAFFRESSKILTEVFNLKSDKTNKILERIPKLGLIPKALRVGDQIRLTRCIMKDYKAITEVAIKQNLDPFARKYKKQYETIKEYIYSHPDMAYRNKRYTEACLAMLEQAKTDRFNVDTKLIQTFGAAGMNISNICRKVNAQGLFDLARKTVMTFISLT